MDNERALGQFLELTRACEHKLVKIMEYMTDHGDYSPHEINYSHVGSMQKVNNDLADIISFLGIENV